MLKERAGLFSTFRGNMSLCVAANGSGERYYEAARRARAFYDAMKAKHPLLTGQDDTIFAVLLGLSDLDVQAGAERMAALYRRLRPEFSSGNSVQTLTQVLALSGGTDETLLKLFRLRDTLREKGIRLDRTYTLPALGLLAALPAEADILAAALAEARDFLRAQKGFGALSVSAQELLLYAAALVSSVHAAGDAKSGVVAAAVSTGVTNMIIAAQVAMMVAMAAASTSAAAASASS